MPKCRLFEAEQVLTDYYDKVDSYMLVDLDETRVLAVCDKGLFVPQSNIFVKGGVVCVRDESSGIYMPEDKVTILMKDKHFEVGKEIMYIDDNVVSAISIYLNDAVSIRELEQYECIFEE